PPNFRTSGLVTTMPPRKHEDTNFQPRLLLRAFVASWPETPLLPTRLPPGDYHNAVRSSMPSITLRFCTAWPEAPFSRLSMTDTRTARPEASARQPMSQKFVCATCLISGSDDPTSRMKGAAAYLC